MLGNNKICMQELQNSYLIICELLREKDIMMLNSTKINEFNMTHTLKTYIGIL